jgi:hypothetical protein
MIFLEAFHMEHDMKDKPDGSNRFSGKSKLYAMIIVVLLISLACGTSPDSIGSYFKKPAAPAQPPSGPPPNQPVPPQPGKEEDTSSYKVIGGWYGPACDEAEGTYIYRWSVDLMQNPATGQYVGTVKFHDCPEGGRVLYRVVGDAPTGQVFTLSGVKKDGGGNLLASAPETNVFTFDQSSGTITPNLAP